LRNDIRSLICPFTSRKTTLRSLLIDEHFLHRDYKDYIYRGQPDPPLAEADRAWAEELAKHVQSSQS